MTRVLAMRRVLKDEREPVFFKYKIKKMNLGSCDRGFVQRPDSRPCLGCAPKPQMDRDDGGLKTVSCRGDAAK